MSSGHEPMLLACHAMEMDELGVPLVLIVNVVLVNTLTHGSLAPVGARSVIGVIIISPGPGVTFKPWFTTKVDVPLQVATPLFWVMKLPTFETQSPLLAILKGSS